MSCNEWRKRTVPSRLSLTRKFDRNFGAIWVISTDRNKNRLSYVDLIFILRNSDKYSEKRSKKLLLAPPLEFGYSLGWSLFTSTVEKAAAPSAVPRCIQMTIGFCVSVRKRMFSFHVSSDSLILGFVVVVRLKIESKFLWPNESWKISASAIAATHVTRSIYNLNDIKSLISFARDSSVVHS